MVLRGFQERKIFRKVVFSTPVAFIVCGVILWMLWSTVSLWSAKIKISQRTDEVKQKIANVEESRRTVERKIESLKSAYGIDFEARNKFNLTKPGEKVVIFFDEQKKDGFSEKNKNLFYSIFDSIRDFFNFSKNEK